MHVVKPFNTSVFYVPFEDARSYYLTLSLFMYFRFDAWETRAAPLPEPEMWQFVPQRLGQTTCLDMGMPKARGEVLVLGDCHAPPGQSVTGREVRFRMGAIDKTVYVFGDRFWHGDHHTDPRPFRVMPVDYAHAYGGSGKAKKCEKNPRGKGAFKVREDDGREVRPLPNVEDSARLVGDPDAGNPDPAGFAPYEMHWAQRRSKLGTFDAAWMEECYPGLPADADWSAYNTAPPDQQIEGFFSGNEPFWIQGMHDTRESVEGSLPGLRGRAFLVKPDEEGRDGVFEAPLRLDTVWLFPQEEHGIVCFRGVVKIETEDAEEFSHLLVGYDRMADAPRPAEAYLKALELLRDPDESIPMPWEVESCLIPPDETPPLKAYIEAPGMEDEFLGEGRLKQNQLRRADRALDELREELRAMGRDPDEVLPKKVEDTFPKEAPGLREMMEEVRKETEAAKSELERHRHIIRNALAETGVDRERARASLAGLDPEASTFCDMLETMRRDGMDIPDELMARARESDELVAQVKEQAKEVGFLGAHLEDPPHPLAEERSADWRRRLREGLDAGASFANADLRGVDLTGVDLPGIDLRRADLSGAILKDAVLRDANLSLAALAHADLGKADLSRANLGGANLGKCKGRGARFRGASLRGAHCIEADLSAMTFVEADFGEAILMDAVARSADFSQACLKDASLFRIDLTEAILREADLEGALVYEATAEKADFSGVTAPSIRLLRVRAPSASFLGARLGNLFLGNDPDGDFSATDWTDAFLEESYLGMANLEGACFDNAELARSNFMRSRLAGASFRFARARGAFLRRANLEKADMTSADLREASLHGARLVSTRLRGSNLFMADLQKAVFGETDLRDTILYKTILHRWQPQ